MLFLGIGLFVVVILSLLRLLKPEDPDLGTLDHFESYERRRLMIQAEEDEAEKR